MSTWLLSQWGLTSVVSTEIYGPKYLRNSLNFHWCNSDSGDKLTFFSIIFFSFLLSHSKLLQSVAISLPALIMTPVLIYPGVMIMITEISESGCWMWPGRGIFCTWVNKKNVLQTTQMLTPLHKNACKIWRIFYFVYLSYIMFMLSLRVIHSILCNCFWPV